MANLTPGQKKLSAVVGSTAAATMLISTVALFEGDRTTPYRDVIGVWTVCYGETNAAMRTYSEAECKDMLAASLVNYAGPVLEISPELKGHGPQIVAASSLAYNVGVANYRKSSVARDFRAGHWQAACNDFLKFSYAGGHQVHGLLVRREAERKICLTGLS